MQKLLLVSILTLSLYLLELLIPLYKRKIDFKHLFINIALGTLGSTMIRGLQVLITFYGLSFFEYSGLLASMEQSIYRTLISIIILDFMIWLQHVASHKIPLLWRLHRVHHCDHFLDTSSGVRFHPAELILSFFYKMLIVVVFGISLEDFLLFEIIITSLALFNHSNLNLGKFDELLSYLIVTPKMHQVHHSDWVNETNSNYGFNISLWDRLFGTYIDFKKRNENFKIGLKQVQYPKTDSFSFLLKWPLSRD